MEESVQEIKSRIEELEGIPSQRQMLMCGGDELSDDTVIRECIKFNGDCTIIDCIIKGSMHLFVEMDTPALHSRMCLQVIPEMQIIHVKRMIEQQRHIPTYLQTLTYRKEKLEDLKHLTEYGVTEKSAFHLTIEPQGDITRLSVIVRSTRNENEEVNLTAVEDCDQSSIYSSLRRKTPYENNMYYNSVLLDKEEIPKHPFTHNSTVYVSPYNEIPLVVRRPGVLQSTVIGVTMEETIAVIKSKLDGASPAHQLFQENLPLPDGQTVVQCEIKAASEVLLVGPREMPIFIRTRFRDVFLCCNPSSTVGDLKTNISQVLGIPEHRQRLVFNQNAMLKNTETIKSCGIFPGATVYLAVCPNELDIHILLPSKKVTTLVCSSDETIQDIVLKIEQNEGIPVEYQTLPFQNDKMTLKEANVKPGIQLQLTYDSFAHVNQLQLLDTHIQQKLSLTMHQQTSQSLRNELQEVSAHATEQEKLKEEFQADIDQLHSENMDLHQNLKDTETKVAILLHKTLNARAHESRELQESKAQLVGLQRKLEIFQAESQRFQRENDDLQERLEVSQTESQTLKREKDDLQEKLEVSQTESQTLRRENENLHQRLESLQQKAPQPDNIAPWNVRRKDISMTNEIGRGSWGVVMKGTFKKETVAVKQPHQDILNEKLLERLKRETRVMIQIYHPNLVRIIAVVFDRDAEQLRRPPLIITELLDINLRQCYLQKRLQPNSRIPVFFDVAYGLHYLHTCQEPIIHRDVSAPNILLKALPHGMWRAKVSDFGSANLARLSVTAGEGAIVYTAPEAFPPRDPTAPQPRHTTKIDVYSFGILMCEVITKEQPDPEQYHVRLQQVRRISRPAHSLIVRCTDHDPDKRPSMAEVINELNKISLP